MVLELTPEEVTLLGELLNEAVRDLGPEIHHTDSRQYRTELKKRREALRALHERLVGLAAGAAS